MIAGAYDAFDDPYCYRRTSVLKNRARLRDQEALDSFELEMSMLRAEEPLPAGAFDILHYRAIHYHLFQDVYAWAGRYRTVRTAKDGNSFCYPEYMAQNMEVLFARLRTGAFVEVGSAEAFIVAAANFLAELNAIHPFRDGNGRTQLSFLFLVADQAGHQLALELIEKDRFLPAMVASFHGNLAPLEVELTIMLSR